MAAATLITLRETLEASLIVGIVLAYLRHTENERHAPVVWLGVLAGVAVSLFMAFLFHRFVGGFTGRAEELYEGFTMLFAAGLLTWMILWMLRQRRTIKRSIEKEVQTHIENDHPWGLFLLTLVSTAREGIETVIFLQATLLHTNGNGNILGGFLGIVAAIVLSYILFKGFVLVSLKRFFTVTSVMLIFFGAGLVAHGAHELSEAGLVPPLIEHVWDINPTITSEGMYPLLHDKGAMGSIIRSLFGYNGDPSLLELLSYVSYLGGIAVVWRTITKRGVRERQT